MYSGVLNLNLSERNRLYYHKLRLNNKYIGIIVLYIFLNKRYTPIYKGMMYCLICVFKT